MTTVGLWHCHPTAPDYDVTDVDGLHMSVEPRETSVETEQGFGRLIGTSLDPFLLTMSVPCRLVWCGVFLV